MAERSQPGPVPGVDLRQDVPHSARVYDYLLGGKDNYAADRAAGDASVAAWPSLPVTLRQNRLFMRRATRVLVREYGIRQFLDIGTGIPTSPNLHEVAQEAAPECRVVYVDHDPIVLAHARALLTSTDEGRTGYIQADLREPEAILAHPQLRQVLDLTQPVALSLIAVVHFVPDEHDPQGIIRRLLEELAPGSFLALTAATADLAPEEIGRAAREYNERGIAFQTRSRAEFTRFFDGLELIEPGVVLGHRWRPDPHDIGQVSDAEVGGYGAVARKV